MKVLTRGPRTVGGPAVLVLPVISAIFRPEATDVNEQEDEMISLDSLFFIGSLVDEIEVDFVLLCGLGSLIGEDTQSAVLS